MGQIFNSTEYTTELQTIPILNQLKVLTTLEIKFLKENIKKNPIFGGTNIPWQHLWTYYRMYFEEKKEESHSFLIAQTSFLFTELSTLRLL